MLHDTNKLNHWNFKSLDFHTKETSRVRAVGDWWRFLKVIPGRPKGCQGTAMSQGVFWEWEHWRETGGTEFQHLMWGHKLGWALQLLIISMDPDCIWAPIPSDSGIQDSVVNYLGLPFEYLDYLAILLITPFSPFPFQTLRCEHWLSSQARVGLHWANPGQVNAPLELIACISKAVQG